MKQKILIFSNLLFLVFISFTQNSYPTQNKEVFNLTSHISNESEKLVKFVIDNRLVDLKKVFLDGVLEGSIKIQINDKLVNKSFNFELLDIETQKKIHLELIMFFFDREKYNGFNLKLFDENAAQNIHTIICSYFKLHENYDEAVLIAITRFLYSYYLNFPNKYLTDLEALAFKVINTNQIHDNKSIYSYFTIALISKFIEESDVIDINHPKGYQEFQSEKTISYILEHFKLAYSFNNPNIFNAISIAYQQYFTCEIVKEIYHKYKEKSPVVIIISHYGFDPYLKEKSDVIIPQFEQMLKADLGAIPLSYIYLFLSRLYDPMSKKQEEYLNLSLQKNYMYGVVCLLGKHYLLNNQPTKATKLFINILNNVQDYEGISFSKEDILRLYNLSLQLSLITNHPNLLIVQKNHQASETLLIQQEEILKNRIQLKKNLKEKRDQKKIALIKEALQKYHEEQQKLEQQKKEQQILEQQRKEQFEKDKQAWALKHQNKSYILQPNEQSKQKKKKKKDSFTSASIESTPSVLENVPNKKTLTYSTIAIESIIKGNPLKIFCKFFERIEMDKTDQQVQISMKEFETLMEALGQTVVSAKGSHKKVEMDFHYLNTDLENKILVLSNKTFLLPYQIKQIREKFLDYGLYPKELLENLINKGFMPE